MTRSRTQPTTETAAQAYAARATEIEVQMKALADALAAHHRRHEAQPTNWGLVGDLGHVRDLLAETIAFLGGGR